MMIVGLQPTVIALRAPHLLLEQIVGLQPTVIASRAPHLLLEQSVMTKNRGRASPVNEQSAMIQKIVDVHR